MEISRSMSFFTKIILLQSVFYHAPINESQKGGGVGDYTCNINTNGVPLEM